MELLDFVSYLIWWAVICEDLIIDVSIFLIILENGTQEKFRTLDRTAPCYFDRSYDDKFTTELIIWVGYFWGNDF